MIRSLPNSLIDWEPYRPFTIGFDSFLDRLTSIEMDSPSYPPYNIYRTGDFTYSIEVALAGFNKKNIDVTYADNTLTIKSKKQEDNKDMLHKGISQRAFTRSFCLAEDIVVKDAKFTNGMLGIELEKIVPEEKKPKTIKIK